MTTDVRTNVWIEEKFHPHRFGPFSGRKLPRARVRDYQVHLEERTSMLKVDNNQDTHSEGIIWLAQH